MTHTQSRPTPVPGQVYQHFKGDFYTIVFVQKNCIRLPELERFCLHLKGVEIEVTTTGPIDADETMVVYTKDNRLYWARPLSNFLEVLGDTDDPIGGTQYYRFMLVRSGGGNG